jgi:hypothetical protein
MTPVRRPTPGRGSNGLCLGLYVLPYELRVVCGRVDSRRGGRFARCAEIVTLTAIM